ncbi:DUF1934 domain-containing protein [[Eubacterium] hominis]|uniref:DUF1934 domain-containing protein n=1 Tax=[Eubacterium] hominis TaxID=2764325 RepID=UPI003A4E3B37
MKKHLIVKQKDRYTDEKNLMFDGYVDFMKKGSLISIEYVEKDQTTTVKVKADDDELQLERKGEIQTQLLFRHKETTIGSVLSEFGTIELGIYTHKYIRKDNIIALEYDILSEGEVTDGYRILWILKEDQA